MQKQAAATLRSRTAGSQDESRCGAIHKCNGDGGGDALVDKIAAHSLKAVPRESGAALRAWGNGACAAPTALGIFLLTFPGLPAWASLWRAYGAGLVRRTCDAMWAEAVS
jgi:hypothetical protein